MKYIALLVSLIFQPLLVPTAVFYTIFLVDSSQLIPFSNEYFYPFILIVFLGTYLLPSFMILVFRLLKITDSYLLDSKKDRLISAIMVLIFWSIFTYVIQIKFGFNILIINILISICFILFITSILNYFYRFSLHTFAISTLTSLMFFGIYFSNNTSLQYQMYIYILLSGFVGWSRLYLQKHDIIQLAVGYFLGACVGIGSALYIF